MFLIMISIILFCFKQINFNATKTTIQSTLDADTRGNEKQTRNNNGDAFPDIYYIILDSYPSNRVLKNYFQYDNYKFLRELESRGFYIPEKSTSNYTFTLPSLASSLNMSYLDTILVNVKNRNECVSILNKCITKNRVMQILKDKGYEIVTIGSWWQLTSNKSNKFELGLNEFVMEFLRTTILKDLTNKYFIIPEVRHSILNAIKKLQEIPGTIRTPKFVFAHILCPHPPVVFQANGAIPKITRIISDHFEHTKLFCDQIQYLNTIVLQSVDTIIAKSNKNAIIILQGDHGCAYVKSPIMDSDAFPDTAFIIAQQSILNAYFMPKNIKNQFYESITPVNTFRIILNKLFNLNEKPLQDKNYYSNHLAPQKLTETTQMLRGK